MSRFIKALITLISLPIVCTAQIAGVDTLDTIHASDYHFAEDHVITSEGYLNWHEAASDSTGKVYHFIFGASHEINGNGGILRTRPIDTRGYHQVSIQFLESSVMEQAYGGELIPYVTAQIDADSTVGMPNDEARAHATVKGSVYTSGIVITGATTGAMVSPHGVPSATQPQNLFTDIPIAAGSWVAGATDGYGSDVDITRYGIYNYEMNGGIASIVVDVSKVDMATERSDEFSGDTVRKALPDGFTSASSTAANVPITRSTQHVIIRVDR